MNNQADAIEDIRFEMEKLAYEWRLYMTPLQDQKRQEEIEKNPEKSAEDIARLIPQVPVIFGFAVMEHNVVIVHMDAATKDAVPFLEMNLDMETDNQRQWYTLMIMVTICYARDKLMVLASRLGLAQVAQNYSSDPDA
jgi:hypothetical protein